MKNKLAFALAAALGASSALHAAATITIVNGDPAGVGFNDATTATPVGGNTGTTVGQQRLNAFQAAANKWGATLTAVPIIRVLATWEALSCNATGAVLGSAGATTVYRDFAGAPRMGTWFGKAQTAALVGFDPEPSTADIRARFNVNLGQADCLAGRPFYLGLDNNHGNAVDLVAVLLHEFGHGLGFQTFTNGTTGANLAGFPSIWDHFLTDTSLNKTWVNMTNAERAASAIRTGKLTWAGTEVNDAAANVLSYGVPVLSVTAPASVAGKYLVGTASFGPPLNSAGIVGKQIMPVVDQTNGTGLACTPLSPANAAAVVGKFALVDRGTCNFNVKAGYVQAAGAVGMIVADNAPGNPPATLGGTDTSITIPSVRITQDDGIRLKAALAIRTRTASTVIATLILDMTAQAGRDFNGRMLMFAPNPFQGGSSVSHFDVSAFPNQLMEPSINADLTHEVTPPQDLTYKLLRDIGWQ